jgi:hypothetical protein
MTGISCWESEGYWQFSHRNILYDDVGNNLWPFESNDGGSHIGLMQVPTTMNTAWDWKTNTYDGVVNWFINQKLPFSHSYVDRVRVAHPGLRDLTPVEHENNALILYGEHASATQHYYEPNSDFTDWIINTAGNPDGVIIADKERTFSENVRVGGRCV